jgi:hypothetical protein
VRSAGFYKRKVMREEAESMLPKVKSWRDAGDTPYRKNHREQAKF